ncbi:MAG: hypothetical protein WA123_12265 [Methylotenera sp.]
MATATLSLRFILSMLVGIISNDLIMAVMLTVMLTAGMVLHHFALSHAI